MESFREGQPELQLAPGTTNGIIKVINSITYNINIIHNTIYNNINTTNYMSYGWPQA